MRSRPSLTASGFRAFPSLNAHRGGGPLHGGASSAATAVGSLDAGMSETVNGLQDVDRAASDLHGTAERIGAIVREFRI